MSSSYLLKIVKIFSDSASFSIVQQVVFSFFLTINHELAILVENFDEGRSGSIYTDHLYDCSPEKWPLLTALKSRWPYCFNMATLLRKFEVSGKRSSFKVLTRIKGLPEFQYFIFPKLVPIVRHTFSYVFVRFPASNFICVSQCSYRCLWVGQWVMSWRVCWFQHVTFA